MKILKTACERVENKTSSTYFITLFLLHFTQVYFPNLTYFLLGKYTSRFETCGFTFINMLKLLLFHIVMLRILFHNSGSEKYHIL